MTEDVHQCKEKLKFFVPKIQVCNAVTEAIYICRTVGKATVAMWRLQLKMFCVLLLAELKSMKRVLCHLVTNTTFEQQQISQLMCPVICASMELTKLNLPMILSKLEM